jgi:hypothetical protein
MVADLALMGYFIAAGAPAGGAGAAGEFNPLACGV